MKCKKEMMKVVDCPECNSKRIRCIENGTVVMTKKFGGSVYGDMYMCLDCDARFVAGLGDDSKEWG